MFRIGDNVKVNDPGLAMLRRLMGGKPNHHGIVEEILEDGTLLINFPIGDDDPEEHSQVAPYPPEMVEHR